MILILCTYVVCNSQDGCAFRDHVITLSSTHDTSTDTDKEALTPNQHVYAILCKLRETICAEALKNLTNKNNDGASYASDTSSSNKNGNIAYAVQQETLNELWFLRNEAREPRLPPSVSGAVPLTDVAKRHLNEGVQHISGISHATGGSSGVRHSHRRQRAVGGKTIPRRMSRDFQQQSHDQVELEEDEESERTQVFVQPSLPRKGKHVCT